MTWAFVLRQRELEQFLRCRRAWDLGSRVRQNHVPLVPSRVFDFDRAIHDALAVYYFPAMDDWDRAIVRPLAMEGFVRAMHEQRALYEALEELTPSQEEDWNRHLEFGQKLLAGYFQWAPAVDEFDSLLADEEFWAPIPDPASPDDGMVTPEGSTIRFFGRVDQVIADPDNRYWAVEHRLVQGEWTSPDQLLLDAVGLRYAWAMEYCYPQIFMTGTVLNELRTDGLDGTDEDGTAAELDREIPFEERDQRDMTKVRRINLRRSPSSMELPGPDDPESDKSAIVSQEVSGRFRRTFIQRSRVSINNIGLHIAMQALEIRDPDVRIYPSPAPENCPTCEYRRPCLAQNEGPEEAAAILDAHYRRRTEQEFEEERLRYSPARQGARASLGGKAYRGGPPPSG